MKRNELERILKQNGFYVKRSGKHVAFTNGTINVFVPHHKEINGKTAHVILKNAGIKL